jgi:hypothetical protein
VTVQCDFDGGAHGVVHLLLTFSFPERLVLARRFFALRREYYHVGCAL